MCNIGEIPSVCWQSNPVARKEHKCCECGSIISPKEQYELCKGVWDGEFSSYKTCSICSEIRINYNKTMAHDETACFGELWDIIQGSEFELING